MRIEDEVNISILQSNSELPDRHHQVIQPQVWNQITRPERLFSNIDRCSTQSVSYKYQILPPIKASRIQFENK